MDIEKKCIYSKVLFVWSTACWEGVWEQSNLLNHKSNRCPAGRLKENRSHPNLDAVPFGTLKQDS